MFLTQSSSIVWEPVFEILKTGIITVVNSYMTRFLFFCLALRGRSVLTSELHVRGSLTIITHNIARMFCSDAVIPIIVR